VKGRKTLKLLTFKRKVDRTEKDGLIKFSPTHFLVFGHLWEYQGMPFRFPLLSWVLDNAMCFSIWHFTVSYNDHNKIKIITPRRWNILIWNAVCNVVLCSDLIGPERTRSASKSTIKQGICMEDHKFSVHPTLFLYCNWGNWDPFYMSIKVKPIQEDAYWSDKNCVLNHKRKYIELNYNATVAQQTLLRFSSFNFE
jgi:hypothetical protein